MDEQPPNKKQKCKIQASTGALASEHENTIHASNIEMNFSSTRKSCELKMETGNKISGKHSDQTTQHIPIEGRCQFYIKKKNRCCKTVPPQNKKYCVEHSYEIGDEGLRKRVPCPLDPKHTCYEDHLQKHLKKCNARKLEMPAYYVENINNGEADGGDPNSYRISIRDIPDKEVLELVETVKKLHAEYIGAVCIEVLFHDVLQDEADKPTNGSPAQKHIQQQASLVGHLNQAGLLLDNCSYLEFGAGKGGLSHWVQLAVKHCSNNQYILIDKGSVRYKMDNYHKGSDQGPSFERLKIDIQHLLLDNVPSLVGDARPIVGLGKHLCGGATDLMLRCLMGSSLKKGTDEQQLGSVLGLTLALCCHHRCDWKTYIGKEFFHTCGLTAREFHLCTTMSSWATCGARPVGGQTDVKNVTAGDQEQSSSHSSGGHVTYNHQRYGNLLPEEREQIGRQCKQLIDMGRVKYLQSNGYKVKLLEYVEKAHTLENMALVATQPQKTDVRS